MLLSSHLTEHSNEHKPDSLRVCSESKFRRTPTNVHHIHPIHSTIKLSELDNLDWHIPTDLLLLKKRQQFANLIAVPNNL
jgi:hypothetical protein